MGFAGNLEEEFGKEIIVQLEDLSSIYSLELTGAEHKSDPQVVTENNRVG